MKNPGAGREIKSKRPSAWKSESVRYGPYFSVLSSRNSSCFFPFDANLSLLNVEETVRTGILDPGDIRNAPRYRFGPSRL